MAHIKTLIEELDLSDSDMESIHQMVKEDLYRYITTGEN